MSAAVRRTLKAGEIPSTLIECQHAVECAGCPHIANDYAQQLEAKRARVRSAVAHYPSLELLYTQPVIPADPIVGYRGRAKLIVSPTGAIGLYGRTGHHEVIDIPSCRVLAPALSAVTSRLRELIAAPPPEARALLLPYDPTRGGVLRAIDLREVHLPASSPLFKELGAREDDPSFVLITFVLQRERAVTREELREAGKAIRPLLPRVVGVAANFHDAEAPQILGPETILLDGVSHVPDQIGPTYHIAAFGSFVQAHRTQAARVHAMLLREITSLERESPTAETTDTEPAPVSITERKPLRLLDLYGGSGAIALALAHGGNRVLSVESFAPAAANARAAAESQNLSSLMEVRTGDVADVVAQLAAAGERFHAVVINPPRRGISPTAREAVARLAAPLLVYVSCDPDTLARDLDHMSRLGYSSTELTPLDMIPLTEEVETIVALRRTPAPPPRVIYDDDGVLVVEKGPHEPVGPQQEYLGSLLARCARIPGVNDLLHVVHALDPGTSGLCMLARDEEALARWGEALATTGRLIYVAAAKGVTPGKGAITRDLREGNRVYSARTRYRRLAVASGHSILRVIPDGGRTHQIRRHLAAIGHPVLGDERYGHVPTNRYFEEKHGLDRSFVHLVRIEITHPRTGVKLIIESTLPGDLRSALQRSTGPSVIRFLEQKHALGENRVSAVSPVQDEPAPSSRYYIPEEGEPVPPSIRVPMPISIRVPDLDDSPRTLRHPIVPTGDDE
ncbi:RNA methyltransferase [Chondromyces crocatus]|uniref:RNA methyltransferase n=1 Tax=Chondromyces crocatus TaxID=52 RepID=A0A0K1ELU9_CHOCO|nr:RNA methyltransferase [Chondromyces crocatus]